MVTARDTRRQRRKELYGILFLALGVFFSLCLVSYDPADPALNVASNVKTINNLAGIVGAYTADILFSIFGVSAYLICLIFFLVSAVEFLGKTVAVEWKEAIAYFVLIVSVAAIIHLRFELVHISGKPIEGGGLLGGIVGEALSRYLNRAGAYMVASTLAVASFMLATPISLVAIVRGVGRLAVFLARHLTQRLVIYSERGKKSLKRSWDRTIAVMATWWRKKEDRVRAMPKPAVKINYSGKAALEAAETAPDAALENGDGEVEPNKIGDGETEAAGTAATKSDGPKIFERRDVRGKKPVSNQLELSRISQNYVFPPLAMLDSPDQKIARIDESLLKKNSQLLEMKMLDYGVEGRVTEIHPGPIVTMYEFQPAPGVKVNKVVGIEDDLSVAMGGKSVRVVPHIPGKAAVGVEIPNGERETVWLKQIIGDEKFASAKTKLTLALGKNIEGHVVVGDLTKMPHLLIAGATGSGKSVMINSIICSILYKTTPQEVRLLMVDPKMLELSVYEGIPHLLLPVVTKPKKANVALKWATLEMERRYRLLSDVGVRNISSYNTKVERGDITCTPESEAKEWLAQNPELVVHTGYLPFIVIIIDELADLMMTCAKDVEESIARLAQMARASGIHLIVATQRPSVDVVTGLIKSNFPSRLAFKVSSRIDARTILDSGGAEKLLGMGDMLFMPPNAGAPVRIHGALVTETEIARIVEHVKSQGKPVYDNSILEEKPGVGGLEGEEGDYDELYDQAVEMVTSTRQASISMIQRRFRIGYNRAARIIEKMEMEGVIGPQVGAKPREILVTAHDATGEPK